MTNTLGQVYLIPCNIANNKTECLSTAYLVEAINHCSIFFVESEKYARRFIKSIYKNFVVDEQVWECIDGAEEAVKNNFINYIKQGKNIAIISDAGCPGIADPGQILVAAAQIIGATVKPFVGPSSILLALMASGLNGQQFKFWGYLPIADKDKIATIKLMEEESRKNNCSQIFIETPYRNEQILKSVIAVTKPDTKLCIACNITASDEFIKTKTTNNWKQFTGLDIQKKPTVFILLAS
jgi:16S rRNA (cytidine1402-2'-O)-methyltransferase